MEVMKKIVVCIFQIYLFIFHSSYFFLIVIEFHLYILYILLSFLSTKYSIP